MRPIIATVFPSAFAHNLARARAEVGARTHLHAVVKANAYGHGIARLAPAFAGADGLAVIELENAVLLREGLGWVKELVVLEGFYAADELDVYSRHQIAAVVHCDEQIAMLERAHLGLPMKVFVKINSGMNRLGFPLPEASSRVAQLRASGNVGEIVLMTHFARADERQGFASQLAAFNAGVQGIDAMRSLANSGATLQFNGVGGDYARPGIMLYGGSPLAGVSAASLGLQPAMEVATQVIAVQHVQAGESVGYGGAFTATRRSRIAVLAGGYADGYPRSAKQGTPVWVAGQIAPLVGRVSMDKITVDITDIPAAQFGAPAQLWGRHVSVDTLADHSGTIAYEILTGLNARVPVHVR